MSDAQTSASGASSSSASLSAPLVSKNGVISLKLPAGTSPPDTFSGAATAVTLLTSAVQNGWA